MDKIKALLTWQAVTLVLGGGVLFTLIAIFAPPESRTLLLGANGLIATLIGIALRSGGGDGGAPPAAPLLMLLGAIALGGVVSGCGASPLRQHAIAARMTMATLAGADVAIEGATRTMLERCPGDDGDARTQCIDDVERAMVPVSAARDALIAPAHAYRDAVLASGGEETPGLVDYLDVIASSVARDLDPVLEALRALGVPVPSVPFPGGAR
ncbi:hypothetical protein [Sandaracinus amylolyticus]|nr:hypothetical protein [Sandaracinus amylolyticus]